jgi:LysR family tdc operon transcriptional activator
MKSRLPKMTQLVALNAIVKYGSINAAAKALNIAQPSLSRSIKELEELLNTQLVIRGSLGVTLTPAGESFATNSAMILEAMTRAIDQTYLMSGKTDTLVRFGGSPISARSVVRPALDYLMREFPNCRVHVDDNPIERHIEQLKNGFLDFAIGNGGSDVSFSDFIVEPLFDCPFYIACAKGHPLENATHLSELANANWWITGEHRVMERENFEFKAFNLRKSLSTRAFLLGSEMVLNNGYLALLSSVQIKNLIDHVSVIPIKNFECIGHYVLIRRKNTPLTSAAERLITHLHQVADSYEWSM